MIGHILDHYFVRLSHATGCPKPFKNYSCLKSPKMNSIQGEGRGMVGFHMKMPLFWKNVPLFLLFTTFLIDLFFDSKEIEIAVFAETSVIFLKEGAFFVYI